MPGSIQAAIKSRQNVKQARLSLDATRASLKAASNSSGAKQEQARLEVEQAEEHLVTCTETAINLMRSVLENPEPIRNLSRLLKAQQEFHEQAAGALKSVVAEIEENAKDAEEEYR
ncbi:uncharacterized protein JCM15063_002629 [Sporobolomyces koalae]|uniref:uncharacterized protein n=1 Tax=Sporobolomyces koalae TaxID=500713 RepID=UPI00317AEFB6